MEVKYKIRMTTFTMEDKRQMLNIFKANPSWSQQAIADEFSKKFCKNMKMNTISWILNSSSKIVGIRREATKDVQRIIDPEYLELKNALMAWFQQVGIS
jgi:hypothetical protein